MHYFIDGYNLLFRLIPHSQDDLQSRRELIIHDLNTKVSLLKLDVSIVFDSPFQIGEGSRSHYHELEILFTAEGETADEYILDEIKSVLHPEHETVVTSDKKLALRVRNRLAHTESVEDFILWLNKAYKNKLRQIKKTKQPPFTTRPPSNSLTQRSSSHMLTPSKDAALEACADYYSQVFESKWQEILKQEQTKKQDSLPSKKKQRSPSPKKSTKPQHFLPSQEGEEKTVTEMERWLKIFEERLNFYKF